jgi:hypothetical protein
MCHSGVGSILVMFDILDWYILYMCLLLFVYCIPVLEAPRPGRQTKQEFFLKKILMFISSPMNIRATWGRRGWSGLPRGSYVHQGTDEHKELTNIRPPWHQGGCRTTWHTLCSSAINIYSSVFGR